MKRAVIFLLFLLFPALVVQADHIPCEVTKLTASDGEVYDFFGSSVAVSGDTAIIGVPNGGTAEGSAYIFRLVDDVWTQEAKLTASDLDAFDYFGRSVAITDDIAVIGAPGANGVHDDSGAAYVFHHDGSTWTEVAKLTASDGGFTDSFGSSVAIIGSTVLIGSPQSSSPSEYAHGAAYLFQRDWGGPDNWGQVQKITASDGEGADYFGWSVSISGDYAAIGARNDDYSGSVYIFRHFGDFWTEEAKLTVSSGDTFGQSVAISGNYTLIGDYGWAGAGDYSGAAYIFSHDGSTWTEEAMLTASDGEEGDFFGGSVSLNGNTAIIGASYDDNVGSDAGSAYIFRFDGTAWIEATKLLASDGEADDRFGCAVAICGATAVIGAMNDDDAGSNAGAAFVYGLVESLCESTVLAELICAPSTGTLPFVSWMTLTLTNQYADQTRRFAGHIDVTLAGGAYFPNWRGGYTNLSPGESYVSGWNQNIPALGTLIGDNIFTLIAEDVTSAPYNQPPYPPSGDTDTSGCTVTGIAP